MIVLCLSNIMTNSHGGFWEVHPDIPFHSSLDCCDCETGMNKKTITQIMSCLCLSFIHVIMRLGLFDSGGIGGVCLVTLLSGCVLDCVVDFMHECGDFKRMFSRVLKILNGKVV